MIYQLNNRVPVLAAEEYFIAPSADVIGDVTIHNQVSIWFGAVLRGDLEPITVGEGSNIQDGVVVHAERDRPTIIGKGVTIGHRATIHGCTIGDNSLIGMNAVLLDGCEIGQNCLVAAGTLIPPGKKIRDNSFVIGVPGKVLRKLTDEEIKQQISASERYIEYFRQYVGRGFRSLDIQHEQQKSETE